MHAYTLFSLTAIVSAALQGTAAPAPAPSAHGPQTAFRGSLLVNGFPHQKEVFFSLSTNRDPLNFTRVNGKSPILDNNDVGVKSVHSPSIVSDPTKNKYFIFGSNTSMLSLDYKAAAAYNQGNSDLIVWESRDETLTKWSKPRAINIGDRNMLHIFNPKAIWDPTRRQHFVYWSGATKQDAKSKIYGCYTDGFQACYGEVDAATSYFEDSGRSTTHMQIFALGDDSHYLRFFTSDYGPNEGTIVKAQYGEAGLRGKFVDVASWKSGSVAGSDGSSLMDDSASPIIFADNERPSTFYMIFNKSGKYKSLSYKGINLIAKVKSELEDFPQMAVEGTVLPVKESQYRAIMKASWD